MSDIKSWFKKVFTDATSRVIATFLAGVLLTAISVIFSGNISNFLRSEVKVNLSLVLILCLFGLIGVSVGIERILKNSIQARIKSKSIVRDENLDTTQKQLLDQLTYVEVGLIVYDEQDEKDFKQELIRIFDQWEIAVQEYISDQQKELIQQAREQIMEKSLSHSKSDAKEWVQNVKAISNSARSQLKG